MNKLFPGLRIRGFVYLGWGLHSHSRNRYAALATILVHGRPGGLCGKSTPASAGMSTAPFPGFSNDGLQASFRWPVAYILKIELKNMQHLAQCITVATTGRKITKQSTKTFSKFQVVHGKKNIWKPLL